MATNISGNSMFLTAETDFGLSMLRHAPATQSLVISPLSVMFALAMVQLGSKGNTRTQINNLLSQDGSDDEIIEHYSRLSQQIMEVNHGVQSRIGNGFFLDKNYQIENDYEVAITKKYSAKVQSLDFSKADEAAKVMNGFVDEVTGGKIQNTVKADDVEGAFSLIVNAIYFTAEWVFKFEKYDNTKQDFFSSETNKREIEFMNDKKVTRLYAENDDFQVLSLPYKDDTYAFNIFLPKKRFELEELKKTLNGANVQQLLSTLHRTFLSVTIPKMRIESDYKLKDALMKMGITDLFGDNADLTGISKSAPLKVSDAEHKAIIEVDEDGTTAAAVTTVKVIPLSLIISEPVHFVADHPFLFILTKDRNPLFMGQFV